MPRPSIAGVAISTAWREKAEALLLGQKVDGQAEEHLQRNEKAGNGGPLVMTSGWMLPVKGGEAASPRW